MGCLQGTGLRSVKWALVAAGLLSTGCAGLIGAGAAVVVVGAGVLGFTCYDRVSVTVTDGLTGTTLCDAKVTFVQGKSETEATSCYQAALSAGSYTLRVERQGLVTFEEPVEVSKSGACGQTVQTMYVALDRKNRVAPPRQIAPAPVAPAPAPVVPAPAPGAPPPAVTPPAVTPPAVAPPAVAPPPATGPTATAPPAATAPPTAPPPAVPPGRSPAAPPPPAPPPASTAFPDAPR
jgi:hypothetical protein